MNLHHIMSRTTFLLIPFLAGNLFEEVKSFSVTHNLRSHSASFTRYQWQKQRSLLVLQAEEGDGEIEGMSSSPPPPPPPSMANAPPPVPPKRLDPLMASLTRMDSSTADLPTKNIPLFGEVPVDGSLALLIPAAGIAVLGFILSIVIAVKSSDEIVGLLSQVSDDLNSVAVTKSSKVYDESVCRGICSSQQQDLEGLRGFMNGLKKE